MRRIVIAAAALFCAAAASVTPASADDYPSRPIRVIVPTPPGGPVDTMARLLTNALPAELGQNVIVENKPGAGNIIGSKAAAEAAPDGYTLIVSSVSGLVLSPMLHSKAGYDASSYAPIALVTEVPQVLVVDPKLPVKSVAELVAYAKAHPGKLNYSTGGIGTLPNLTAELFKSVSGTNIVHVPYKGGHLALNAVMAGETQMTFDTLGTSLPLVRAGKVRAIGIGAKMRAAELPDVATMGEQGYPQLTAGAWTAILAPKGTPAPILAKLNAATNKALKSAAVQSTLNKLGATALGGTPQELADYIKSETAKWGPIVQNLHLKGD